MVVPQEAARILRSENPQLFQMQVKRILTSGNGGEHVQGILRETVSKGEAEGESKLFAKT